MDKLALPYFGPGRPTSRPLAAAPLAAEHAQGRLPARDLCRIIHQHYGHGVPEDCRDLLVKDDNGGAGPGYGLWPLGLWNPTDRMLAPGLTHGAIPIAHLGCAICLLLILTGPERARDP